ncbi:DUF2064 domain-containing protein [uncultured Arcticibacterium sp.]|uniref:TIGR04282 family arsenosugar biosynthesis glycosyltransferase n=1 Tax=uncultured Arcticibacterium sp. TaxID=2173042 RepID=UPI0030FA5703
MKVKASNTALLVFSLSAKAEAERKPLFGKEKISASIGLYHQLINKTKRLAKESGLDVFWFDEKNQVGNSFGEKYANSFQHIFDKGYNNVISIGNDSPDLSSEILADAIQKLNHQDLVLGPAQDGGAYLIGLSSKVFDFNQFKALSWTHKNLFEDLQNYAIKASVAFTTLGTLLDLDQKADLYTLTRNSVLTELVRYILKCLRSVFYPPQLKLELSYTTPTIQGFQLRGPPTYC